MSTEFISENDLVENPTPRVPIALVLDTSGSMGGRPISELNEGVKTFFQAVRSDEIASLSAEIAVITFGTNADIYLDFDSISNQSIPSLGASGITPMGEAVNLALDKLEDRKNLYKSLGLDYFQPWMVLMTDGAPTDSIDIAVKRTVEMVEKRKLTIFPIGIGSEADMDVLKRFSPQRDPLRLKGLNFPAFFVWLSKSVSKTSKSIPGEHVELDVGGIKGWAEI